MESTLVEAAEGVLHGRSSARARSSMHLNLAWEDVKGETGDQGKRTGDGSGPLARRARSERASQVALGAMESDVHPVRHLRARTWKGRAKDPVR